MSPLTQKIAKACGCLLPIVAFFAVLLYPVFTMVRDNARSSSCQSNLKTLGIAFYQYSQDNDQAMPNVSAPSGRNTWREAIFGYVHSQEIYHCPAREDNLDAHGFSQNYAANDSGASTAARPHNGKGAFGGPNSAPVFLRDISTPSELIQLTETENNSRPDFDIDDPASFGPQMHMLWSGHYRRLGSYLLADGHIKRLIADKTYLYDPKNKSLFNYWYRNDETRLSVNGITVLDDTVKRFQ